MQGLRADGPAPAYTDPSRRAALMALLDDGFPGISARISAAAAQGFVWDAVTEPFVLWGEDGRAEAHVGVLEHRIVLDGQEALCAGVHAVVTRSDLRGRGLARRCLQDALSFVDGRYATAKLGTDLPRVYEGHGFVAELFHRFAVDHAGGEDRGRAFTEADRAAFFDLCPRRDPVSHVFGSLDPGWLVGIDLALGGRALTDLVVLDELDVVVDWGVDEAGTLHLRDVFAPKLPPLSDLLRLAPAHRRALLYPCPDRLAPDAAPIACPEEGFFMMRPGRSSRWPFGVSPLAEH